MKKIIPFTLIIVLLFSIVAFAQDATSNLNDQDTFYGVSYTQNNGIYLEGLKLKNIEVSITEDNISGSFKEGTNEVTFNSIKIDTVEKEQIVVGNYTGTATISEVDYLIQISKNENGFSGIIFNEKKDVKEAFIISKQPILSLKEKFNIINKELDRKKLIKIEEENAISDNDVGILSTYYDRSLHIYKDAKDIIFLYSGGTVEGTLYYTKAVNDPTGMTYYFDRVYGYVAWESGFDGLAIINEDEEYGHVWGTPECPNKSNTTWDISYEAFYTSPYYFQATVSYTLLIDFVPVLFWDSDNYLIN